ncbi:unnamed protein product [Arctogadus glacialis]
MGRRRACTLHNVLLMDNSTYNMLKNTFCMQSVFVLKFNRSCYLSKVLRNYTEQACDGDFLSVRCPARTTITVQSAFYGRRGPSHPQQCPQTYRSLLGTYPVQKDDRYCSVSTALQKMLDECQDRRSCQVLVNSRVFGTDQCPGGSKHLMVWYKCRPNEYKSKVACEDERLKLSCKRGMQIAIYSAMFGRTEQGTLECPLHHWRAPSVDCQSGRALQVVMEHCQGKKSCLLRAATRDFGDPCYSGTRKYLSVIYTCDDPRAPLPLSQAPFRSSAVGPNPGGMRHKVSGAPLPRAAQGGLFPVSQPPLTSLEYALGSVPCDVSMGMPLLISPAQETVGELLVLAH